MAAYRLVVMVETDHDAAPEDVINALFEVGCVYPVADETGEFTSAKIISADIEQV